MFLFSPLDGSLADVEVIVSDIVPNSPSTDDDHHGLNPQELCRPRFARNVYWNWTNSGTEAIEPCPSHATGKISPPSFFTTFSILFIIF